MTDSDTRLSAGTDELCILRADRSMLGQAMVKACDLLAERIYGNPARSPGHNARIVLERALAATIPEGVIPAAQAPLSEAERHAIAHARDQVEHSSPDNPDCHFDYELVLNLLHVIERAAQPPAAPVETDAAKTCNSYLQRALDAEADSLRLHNEKMEMYERAIAAEAKLAPVQSCSAVTAGGLLSCPLCRSTQLRRGVTYGYGSSEKRDAVMCLDCGCRATEAAWQGRDALPQEAWQPIETAPKEQSAYPIQICGGGFKGTSVAWWTGEVMDATHWAPMLSPLYSRPHGGGAA
jgi:hypothetical protein